MLRSARLPGGTALLSLVALVGFVLLASCLRGGFVPAQRNGDGAQRLDGPGPTPDGLDLSRPDSTRGPDADGGPERYTPWIGQWTFDEPISLDAANSSGDDFNPFLAANGRDLYFVSDRPGGSGGLDVYVTRRADPTASFGAATPLANVNTSADESSFTMTEDELTAFVTTNRPGGSGRHDIWVSERASTSEAFTTFTALTALNSAQEEFDAIPSPDGLKLYFVSYGRVDSVGQGDFFVAERANRAAAFSAPKLFAPASSASNEGNISFTRDDLVMVFSVGADDYQSARIYYASRASTAEPFPPPALLPVINDKGLINAESLVSPDGSELFFGSTRPGGLGGQDLYHAHFRWH